MLRRKQNRELRWVVRKDTRQVIFKLYVSIRSRLLRVRYSLKTEWYMQRF